MTDDNDTVTPDHDEDAPTAPTSVPNVRPGAVSGLDHELLNPDAAADAEDEPDAEDDTEPADGSDETPAPAPLAEGEQDGDQTDGSDATTQEPASGDGEQDGQAPGPDAQD